jgi:transcriptional regulator with XRE-family HTH domain
MNVKKNIHMNKEIIDKIKFSRNLNRLCVLKGWVKDRQQRLADLTGMSQPTISRYLAGNTTPNKLTVMHLAADLQVNLAWLAHGDGEPVWNIDAASHQEQFGDIKEPTDTPAAQTSDNAILLRILDEQSKRIDALVKAVETIQTERKEVTTEYKDVTKELREGLVAVNGRVDVQGETVSEIGLSVLGVGREVGRLRDRLIDAGRAGNIKLLEQAGGTG